MKFRNILLTICAASLGGCGMIGQSALERETMVNLSPGETYELTDAIFRTIAKVTLAQGFSLVEHADGVGTVSVGYVMDGRTAFEQTFHMKAGDAQGQTRLSMTFAPASTATAKDRLLFPILKERVTYDFDRITRQINRTPRQEIMAQLARYRAGANGALFAYNSSAYSGGSYRMRSATAGTTPVGQNPTPSADATAPAMTAAPGLDPTVR